MEGFTAALLIAFVTIGPSIIDTQYAARTLNGECDFIFGSRHDSAFCIQHLHGNVRNIAAAVGDAHSINRERQLRRAVCGLHLDRPHDLTIDYSFGSKSSGGIGHIP